MSPSRLEPVDHANRVIEAVRRAGQANAGGAVAGSWARCLNIHHLDPHQAGRPPVLGSVELEARRARMADVIECARFEMTTLYQQLGDPECAVVLTDMEGVIVQMVISPEFDSVVRPLGLEDGAVWSEAEAGTNGMGTCAAEAGPVVVHQDEHFFTEFTSLTCSAVPIHDPTGRLCGVLDVSSRSPTSPQHLLLLLGMTARMIENRLIEMRFPHAYSIRFHSRPEFVYTLHEGKLVVDASGHVLAANRGAALQLGLPSVPELRSQQIDKLFQCSLDDMLQRTQRAAYHPVVTYRANAAHRFFAVARPPMHDEDHLTLQGAETRTAGRGAALVRLGSLPALSVGRSGAVDSTPLLRDPRLQSHLDVARRVVARGTPLLLCGETGSGKEVFARAVHMGSERAQRPFVAINCASLPETLIESELFGYRAGAFTGAERRGRPGKILQADGGTLFLDEIGDMPLMLQARLLRVLDERTVTPLGSEDAQAVDFQLISASHRSIPQLVAQGQFREDLYYRLAGIELRLPALHERTDRAELIRAVLAQEGGPDLPVSPEAWDLLMTHPWPGNVRQLRHVLRGAVALADGQVLRLSHLGALLHSGSDEGPVSDVDAGPMVDLAALAPQQLQERQSLLQLLESHRWNVSHAAKALDVSRNTLYRRMHRLHIPVTPVS